MEWLKDPLNSSSPLTFEEGLKTIDAFYTEEERHLLEDTAPLPDRQTGKDDDDFSTLMEDIDQLNAPSSDQPQTEENTQIDFTQDTTSLNLIATTTEQTAEATLEDHLVQDNASLDQSTAPTQQPETHVAVPKESDHCDASQDQVIGSNDQALTQVRLHLSPAQDASSSDQPSSSDAALDNNLVQDSTSLDPPTTLDQHREIRPTLQNGLVESEASHEQKSILSEQAASEVHSLNNRIQDTASSTEQSEEPQPESQPTLVTGPVGSEPSHEPSPVSEEQALTRVPLQDSLVQDTAQPETQSPEPRLNMTPKQKEREQLPSSEGKSSMMDEMRSEERRYPLINPEEEAAAAAIAVAGEIHLPGLASGEADDVPQLDIFARSHRPNLHTELNAVAVKDDVATSVEVVDSEVGTEMRRTTVGKTTKKRIRRSTKQQVSNEEEMFPDLPTEAAKEEAVDAGLGGKRKREDDRVSGGVEDSAPAADKHTAETGHIVKKRMTRSTKQQTSVVADMPPDAAAKAEKDGVADAVTGAKRKRDTEDPSPNSDKADHPAKEAKKLARRSTRNLVATDTTTESPTNRRSSRNIVGKREIAALEKQKPQRSNSNRRETRAEVAKGPNAGLAVKERRRAMEMKDSEK